MTTRTRRNEEQLIADLEAKIASLKNRAQRKQVKKDPTLKHISAAVRSIDKAMSESSDVATRMALDEARTTLSACLSLNGVVLPGVSKSRTRRVSGSTIDEDELLNYVRNNPGQRGEQISEALGTHSNTMRPVMKKLITEKKIKTKGERRGMQYAAV